MVQIALKQVMAPSIGFADSESVAGNTTAGVSGQVSALVFRPSVATLLAGATEARAEVGGNKPTPSLSKVR